MSQTRPDLRRRSGVLPAGPKLRERAAALAAERRGRWVRRGRRGALALGGLLTLVLVAGLVLASPLLDVDRVEVTGTGRLTPAQVVAAARVDPGTSLLRLDAAAVQRRVEALPAVARVEVVRDWPGTVRLTVIERTTAAAVAQAGQPVRLVDADGTVFGTAQGVPAGVPTLTVPAPGPQADDATTTAALDVLTELSPALRSRVVSVRGVTPQQVVVLDEGGRRIVWGAPGGDADRKSQAALLLLGRPGGQIDVSSAEVAVVSEP